MGLKILKRLTPCKMADFSCGDFFVVPCYCAQKQHHKVHEARVNRINCAYNTSPTYATIGFFGPQPKRQIHISTYLCANQMNISIHEQVYPVCLHQIEVHEISLFTSILRIEKIYLQNMSLPFVWKTKTDLYIEKQKNDSRKMHIVFVS